MFAKDSGLLQGTLELLVLKTLSWGPMHGYGIAAWIEGATGDVLRVEEGSCGWLPASSPVSPASARSRLRCAARSSGSHRSLR